MKDAERLQRERSDSVHSAYSMVKRSVEGNERRDQSGSSSSAKSIAVERAPEIEKRGRSESGSSTASASKPAAKKTKVYKSAAIVETDEDL